jgi:hypothetical protein
MNNVSVKRTDGSVVTMSYDNLCHDLGIIPSIRFVAVTSRQTISYTAGKPNEIRYLARMCKEKGYVPAKALN